MVCFFICSFHPFPLDFYRRWFFALKWNLRILEAVCQWVFFVYQQKKKKKIVDHHLECWNRYCSIEVFTSYIVLCRWYAKRFLHPDIVAAYEYIFIWDEDLGLDNFNGDKYLLFLIYSILLIFFIECNF